MTWIEYLLNAAQKSKWNLELWVRYLNKVIQRDKILLSKTDIDYLINLGIDLPLITNLIIQLNLKGYHIDTSINDIDALVEVIGGELHG